jgi:hypothetical protein
LPLPVAPAVTVIHEALLEAVHPQPLAAVTVKLAGPPLAPAEALVAERTKLHAASCVTVNVCPATVNVPERPAPVFAATE